jgi:hypothetical protein
MSIEPFTYNVTQTPNESCILGVVVGDSLRRLLLSREVGYIRWITGCIRLAGYIMPCPEIEW